MRETNPPTSPSPSSLLEEAEVALGSTPQQLTRMGQGKHVCFLYKEFEEQIATFGPFMRMGLARGERCVYIRDEHGAEEISASLRAHGVDVTYERSRGALLLVT